MVGTAETVESLTGTQPPAADCCFEANTRVGSFTGKEKSGDSCDSRSSRKSSAFGTTTRASDIISCYVIGVVRTSDYISDFEVSACIDHIGPSARDIAAVVGGIRWALRGESLPAQCVLRHVSALGEAPEASPSVWPPRSRATEQKTSESGAK